jgi:hypothetical protein
MTMLWQTRALIQFDRNLLHAFRYGDGAAANAGCNIKPPRFVRSPHVTAPSIMSFLPALGDALWYHILLKSRRGSTGCCVWR